MVADLKASLPGVALCVAVTAVAKLIEQAEVGCAGHPYLEGLVVAILLGVLIRAFWAPGPVWKPGIGMTRWPSGPATWTLAPIAVSAELPVVVQPVVPATVPIVSACPLVRLTEPVLTASVPIRLPASFRL